MGASGSIAILVVDDSRTMVRIIRNLLQQIDYTNVDDANDGAAALGKLRAGRYDLVISDWNMQPMSGLDLLRAVRAETRLAATPFIMVTAESKQDQVAAARDAGVSDYIVKPFSASILRSKIEALPGTPLAALPQARAQTLPTAASG